MNQDLNNQNNNDFNMQGNNRILDNQSLNNTQNSNNTINQNTQQNFNVNQFQQQSMQNVQQSINSSNTNMSMLNTQNGISQGNAQSSNQISNTSYQDYQQPSQQYNGNNIKKNKKLLIILGVIVLLIVAVIVVIIVVKNSKNDGNTNVDPTISSSTFEKSGDYYVLKADNDKILLDNIKNYGDIYTKEFCNGTIKITTTDNQVAIINDKGKFIVEPGKYKNISQTGCYYTVTNYDEQIKSKILKYDGNIFFQDSNDVYLRKSSIECAVNYCFSKKVALFTTENKYQLLDSKGNVIKEYQKIGNEKEPEVDSKYQDEKEDRYITSYYNGKTDVIDTNNYKIIVSLNGKYYVKDINKNNKNQFILYKNDNNNRHTIVFNNGKQSFEETTCLNVAFENDNVRCLIELGGTFKYYDINGKEISK